MKPKTKTTASLAVVGVDIGKEVSHGHRWDNRLSRKIRRLSLKDVFEQLPPCVVGMEACLSVHFVSRTLRALGHKPRIIPAIYTKPFVKGQKNDYNDAEAVAEAALRPNLRVISVAVAGRTICFIEISSRSLVDRLGRWQVMLDD